MTVLRNLVLIASLPASTTAFSFLDSSITIPAIHDASLTISSAFSTAKIQAPNLDLLGLYKHSLTTNPLPTKMLTGGTLAIMGDAIAQSRDDETYDSRRAFSFMIFDMCYRALQHFSFPIIVRQCQGQYIGELISGIPPLATLVSQSTDSSYYFAAMEQTLASQLGIVPFLYYPVFYILTAFVQGLTAEGALERARDTFIPLMKRNLLFWIPVQFIQFGFIDEGLQIPFLSVCGLAWTFILSAMAGNAKGYCVKGNEDKCEIDEDDLFMTKREEMEVAMSKVVEEEKNKEKDVSMR